jgi:hypothetical protein
VIKTIPCARTQGILFYNTSRFGIIGTYVIRFIDRIYGKEKEEKEV